MRFTSKFDDPVNGSDICCSVFEKKGITRHKEFKAFFSATDPIKPTPPTSKIMSVGVMSTTVPLSLAIIF